MDRADIINNLRDIGRVAKFYKPELISRLHELGQKIGISRGGKYSIYISTVNQLRTGSISRYTLMDILIGRSDHLWI